MSVLVIAEHDNAALKSATLHTIAAAEKLGKDIHVLVAGHDANAVATAAASIPGVTKVLRANAHYLAQPTAENVARGIYRPLARPLFIYVNAKRVERPDVKAFARYFVRKARELAGDSGSVPMMGMAYTLAEQRLEKMAIGTMFKAPNAAELGVEYLLTQ